MSEYFAADVSEPFTDYAGDSVTISRFPISSAIPYVYLDIKDKHNVLTASVSLIPTEFLKFADTVAEIAKTIRENG